MHFLKIMNNIRLKSIIFSIAFFISFSGYTTKIDEAQLIQKSKLPVQAVNISLNLQHTVANLNPHQTSHNLQTLYQQAEKSLPLFNRLLNNLAAKTNGKAFFAPGLKEKLRAIEKIDDELNQDASLLFDIVRGTLAYNTIPELYHALDIIEKETKIVRFKDKFMHPEASGFRDILLNIQLSNGFIVEIQLQLLDIYKYYIYQHQDYEKIRSIQDKASAENRALTQEEQNEIQTIQIHDKAIYNQLYQQSFH